VIVVVVGEAAIFGSEATARRHVGFAADEWFDLTRAVEQAELGVEMEVNELRCHGRKSSLRILVSGERKGKPDRD
jgi:hypothetical protein